MAKLFGLFNYEKEGPGIDKNAPPKKTFIVFFETFFRNFWKFITVNLVYLICSLPIITCGLANAGITNITRNIARDKHSFMSSDFFETIKKNWKQALPVGIINTVSYALLFFAFRFYFMTKGKLNIIGVGACFAIFIIFSFMNYFIWTLMITFKFSIKQLYTNSFKFAFINLKGNILCSICLILLYAIYIFLAVLFDSWGVLLIEIAVAMLTLPCFRFLLVQYCTFPSIKKFIIDPYYEAHPDEDLEKRRDLGLEVYEEASENDEDEDDGEADI